MLEVSLPRDLGFSSEGEGGLGQRLMELREMGILPPALLLGTLFPIVQ